MCEIEKFRVALLQCNSDKRLAEAEEFTNLTRVSTVNDSYMVEVTLLLLSLLSQNVTVVSVMSFNLTCSGELESLLCTRVCLNFWHFLNV